MILKIKFHFPSISIMYNYKQQIKKFIRKQGISYEFFDFFQSFFLFILHIANKPFNKNEVQSHLHTAIYSNCPSYEKTAMNAAVFSYSLILIAFMRRRT